MTILGGPFIYDGYELKESRQEGFDNRSILNNNLSASLIDSKGDIWFGTSNNGIFKYDYSKELFKKLSFEDLKPDGQKLFAVHEINEHDDGTIWISVPFELGFVYDHKKQSFDVIDLNINEELGFERHTSSIKLSDGQVSLLLRSEILIGSNEEGFKVYKIPMGDCCRLQHEFDDDHIILPYTPGNVYILNKNSGDILTIKESTARTAFAKDTLGNKYLVEENKLYIINNEDFSLKQISDQILPGSEIFLDKEGNLIALSDENGLYRVNFREERIQRTYDSYAHSFKKINQDEFLFANATKIFKYNTVTQEIVEFADFSDYGSFIYNYLITEDGNVFGNLQNKNSIHIINVLKNPEGKVLDLLDTIPIYDTMEKIDGKIGVSSYDWRGQNSSFNTFFIQDLITELAGEDQSIRSIGGNFIEGSNGEIWICNHDTGVTVISKDRKSLKLIKESEAANSLVGTFIEYIYETRHGLKYLVSDKGINIYNPYDESFRLINKKLGLDNYEIHGIIEDNENNVWFITKSKMYKYQYENASLTYFNLPSYIDLINRKDKQLFVDANGYIYFSDNNGIYRFHPSEYESIDLDYNISITDLFIDRERVYPADKFQILDSTIIRQKEFELNYKQKDVGFKFVAPDGQLDNLEYYYRLDGYQENFVKADLSRTIHYTNLNHGDYTFEVRAKPGSGDWIKSVAIREFTIHPPWHMTMVAYLIYGILFFSILYLIYLNKIKQLTKYEMLRSKISSDLHDDVGTILTSVAMQSEVLGLSATEEEEDRFKKLSALSREAMSRMRDTVWAIDARKDTVNDLMERMEDFLDDISSVNNMIASFNRNIANPKKIIPPNIRQNIYLIFKEAVTNSYKHSNGSEIKIEISQSKKSISLRIKDNGVVDPATIKKSGTGISNMELRAKKIGSTLNVNSSDGFSIEVTARI